jgi:acylphosphatase
MSQEPPQDSQASSQSIESQPQRARLLISGVVQGVYYRSAAMEQARVLGLRGMVRNLLSGEVELVAEGPLAVLNQLIAWCHMGPPAARVDKVAVRWEPATDEFVDFRIIRGTSDVFSMRSNEGK